MSLVLLLFCLFLGCIPLLVYWGNVRQYFPPPEPSQNRDPIPQISVLIPARNEANGIAACVHCVLSSQAVQLEVIVMDDQSSDATGQIVRQLSSNDQRVRLITGTGPPTGWNGKQYACSQLAQQASHDWMVFLDADVRLQSDALRRMWGYANSQHVDLLSAFPRQETGTLLEKLLIPMMHVMLLGFLPLGRMRASRQPGFAAGCGQFFLTRKDAYQRAGTHAAIKASRHDGIQLPRIYRQAELSTDVVDGTRLADCRMYRSASEVNRGLLKNADEGIANARLIVPFSVLLFGGTVLPWWFLYQAAADPLSFSFGLALTAVIVGWIPRLGNAVRLDQSPLGAALHPVAVTIFLLIQWWAFAIHLCGRKVTWRGRL